MSKYHIVKLTNYDLYTFTFKGDRYTEPRWFFSDLDLLKKYATKKKYPSIGYYHNNEIKQHNPYSDGSQWYETRNYR